MEKLQLPSRLQILVNQIKHQKQELSQQYLDTYVKNSKDGNCMIGGCTSYYQGWGKLWKLYWRVENKDGWVKPQDLAMSWYYNFLHDDFAGRTWTLGACGIGSRKPSVVMRAFDKFVIYPANCFKTRERLNEYKAFFEPQLDDYGDQP